MILRNPKLLLVAVAAAVSVVAIGVTLIERIRIENQFQDQATRNCLAIEDIKAAITDVFHDGRSRIVERRAELDPAAYRDSLAYYDRQLERFKRKEC